MNVTRTTHQGQPAVNSAKQPFHWVETVALLYLVIPLLLFFAFFIRLEIAIPACALMAILLYELIRKTAWHTALRFYWESAYFLALAVLWVWLSGGIQPLVLTQNADWVKHNLIIDFLAEHSWPPVDQLPHFGKLVLRYYIGWHLVPASIVKMTHANSPILAATTWCILGVFLFFNLLPDLVGKRAAIIAAPLVFMAFSGADIFGTYITQHQAGPLHHFEWWVGWAQFSSNTTALFWSPQQAIPAWLGIALLMRCRCRSELLPYCALFVSATLLWAPLVTIGLAPFLLALTLQHGLYKIIFGWRALLSVLLLAIPVGFYLTAGFAIIPHGYIGVSCAEDAPCFTWPSYFLFLLIEIGAPLAILFLRKEPEHGFLVAAAIALCLIPLYRIGVANDFAMRASLPSLALLSILCAKLFAGPRPYPMAALAVLLIAFPTVAGELLRGFSSNPEVLVLDLATADETLRWWIEQSFAPPPIWVLR
jgi:hypothetical protein